MALEKFYIGPMTSGLQKDVKPFMIADNAFERLKNAYVFRGRVRKRFGERLLTPTAGVVSGYESLYSRLRISVGTTNANGDLTVAAVPGTTVAVGALFSVTSGSTVETFTVTALGVPHIMLTNGSATTHTINTTTGNLIIVGSLANSTVYYYPALPVMGLIQYEIDTVNASPTIAFDTKFAYQYVTASGWARLGTATWSGTNADFFWCETHRGISSAGDVLFVTNNVVADQVKYWDGAAWTAQNPVLNAAGTTLETCRIIISFKNRLLFFNTQEKTGATTTNFQSRCRYSQNGTPLIASDVEAWREDIPGKGGYIDLPSQEVIISAQHLRDRLIVYCERSTWELVYTGNQILPFVWQQINTEFGAESTFSQVPFDTAVLGVGNVGIIACDGQGVQRIDEAIPDEVFAIHNQDNGVQRVAGIRDYFNEHVYWTFPSSDRSGLSVFPDQLLIYSYITKTWAIFDDTITAWGYMQYGIQPLPWSALTGFSWADWLAPWETGGLKQDTPLTRRVMAGNQQGFTFLIDHNKPTNCEALQITNITAGASTTITAINHNLKQGDYIIIDNCTGATELNGLIYPVYSATADTFTIGPVSFSAYTGGGTIQRLSRIDILTKQYNFYTDSDGNTEIAQANFLVDRTTYGEITVDTYVDSSSVSVYDEAKLTGCSLGLPLLETYALTTRENNSERVWRTLYFQAEGNTVQLHLYLTDKQMQDLTTVREDFQWHGTVYHVQPSGRLE